MKNSIQTSLLIVVLALSAFLTFEHFSAKKEVVYIDVNELMSEYMGMKSAQKEFEASSKQWQSNVDTLISQFTDELKSYEKERSKMSKKERELKEEILRTKQQQVSNYQEAMKRKADDEEQKLNQKIYNEVNQYIKGFGKQHGYEMILGANGAGNILYAEEYTNITATVIEGLNKDYESNL